MADHRQIIPISQKLFSLLEKIEENGTTPCVDEPEFFFPEGTEDSKRYDIGMAKYLCSGCPVIDECRMYALEAKEPYGIWGGLTADERASFTKAVSSRPIQSRSLHSLIERTVGKQR
jgi:WhiB family redox-sensing transcriptional regulator